MIQLQVIELSKTFQRRKVFENISFSLRDCDSLVITGPNGSGKTTLLRLLCGFIRPTSGQIIYSEQGHNLSWRQVRQRLGWVAAELVLYEELTAIENLNFFAKVRGLSHTTADSKRLLSMMALERCGNDPVASYSAGMKQRLKFAFALLPEPEILLLDEPSSNLDEEGRRLLDSIIEQQKQRGLLLVATNDPREVHYGETLLQLGAGDVSNNEQRFTF